MSLTVVSTVESPDRMETAIFGVILAARFFLSIHAVFVVGDGATF